MLLLQATDSSAASGGSLVAYGALAVSIITPLVALLNAASSRRTRRERAAANTKTEAESGAVTSGSVLEWRKTDHQALLDERTYAAQTRADLVTSQEEVRTLRDEVAECDRRMDAIIEDLRQLRASIAACPGGPACPLVPSTPAAEPPPGRGSGRTQWRGARDGRGAD
jgi:hypothetical protein